MDDKEHSARLRDAVAELMIFSGSVCPPPFVVTDLQNLKVRVGPMIWVGSPEPIRQAELKAELSRISNLPASQPLPPSAT